MVPSPKNIRDKTTCNFDFPPRQSMPDSLDSETGDDITSPTNGLQNSAVPDDPVDRGHALLNGHSDLLSVMVTNKQHSESFPANISSNAPGFSGTPFYNLRAVRSLPNVSLTQKSVPVAVRDPIRTETESLVIDIVLHYTVKKPLTSANSAAITLSKSIDDILSKHAILFNGMVQRLDLRPENVHAAFECIADELFGDQVTWSRIVTLLAFIVKLALHLKSNDMQEDCLKLAERQGQYLSAKAGRFIEDNGGWNNLCSANKSSGIEGKVWKYLLLTGLGLGLAAAFLSTH